VPAQVARVSPGRPGVVIQAAGGRGRLDLRRLCSWVLPAQDAPRAVVLHRDHPDVSLGLAFAWHPGEVAGRPAFEAAVRTTIEKG
jgi:hypothetical protein